MGPDERDCQPDVAFELDRTQRVPFVETSYWAADDAYWRRHGFDDPAVLAYIQTMAYADGGIACALEVGEHRYVIEQLGLLLED